MKLQRTSRYSVEHTRDILTSLQEYGKMTLKDAGPRDSHTEVYLNGYKIGDIQFKRLVFDKSIPEDILKIIERI